MDEATLRPMPSRDYAAIVISLCLAASIGFIAGKMALAGRRKKKTPERADE